MLGILTEFARHKTGLTQWDISYWWETHLGLLEGGGPLLCTLMAPLEVSLGEFRGERRGEESGEGNVITKGS